MVLNSPGTVDQGYTGEIKVILFNTSKQTVKIEKRQKIAQAVLCPVVCGKWLDFKMVDDIEDKDILKIRINKKRDELKSIESSFIWLYVHAQTDEEKQKLIEHFIKTHG